MRRNLLTSALVFALAFLPASLAPAEDAKERILAEISRLKQSLENSPVADPGLAAVASSASENLSGASAALASGRVYLSLEKLLQAENLLAAARFSVEKSEAVKSSYPAFEAEWKTVSQMIASVNRQSRSKDWPRSPAAVRALAEAALARSVPLLDGGRGFALSSKPADGLFYLGQAQGEAAFASFSSTLPLERNGRPFPLRSLLPELQALQQKATEAFKPPRSVELHQRFIALNSALKLAQELDAQKSYSGALYQYLEATRHFAMLDAPTVEPSKQDQLKERLVLAQRKIEASGIDGSIAALFLERAASQVHHPEGSAPSADEWRSAQVIVDRVLPAYFAVQKPATAAPAPGARTVQLTLVRWPYT